MDLIDKSTNSYEEQIKIEHDPIIDLLKIKHEST